MHGVVVVNSQVSLLSNSKYLLMNKVKEERESLKGMVRALVMLSFAILLAELQTANLQWNGMTVIGLILIISLPIALWSGELPAFRGSSHAP
jgi:hypothetical protein